MPDDLNLAAQEYVRHLEARIAGLLSPPDGDEPENKPDPEKVEAELHAANVAINRLIKFRPLLGGDRPCPWCYAKDGVYRVLITQTTFDDGPDRFLCQTCRREYVV